MNDVARIAVLIGLALVVWLVLRPRATFLVRIAAGEARLARGTAPRGLLSEVNKLCHREGLETGTIQGQIRTGRIGLVFSSDIPPGARQQLRNWWASTQLARPGRSRCC